MGEKSPLNTQNLQPLFQTFGTLVHTPPELYNVSTSCFSILQSAVNKNIKEDKPAEVLIWPSAVPLTCLLGTPKDNISPIDYAVILNVFEH